MADINCTEHPSNNDDDLEDRELTLRRLLEVRETTTDENVHDTEHPSDNNDVLEDPELTLTLRRLREVHHTTTDDDSEHIEAKSSLNSPDNDDIEEFPIVIVHALENRE